MLVELINYYLMGDTPAKAEEFLDAAIKQEPNKAEYYRAKGSLYEKLNQPEKAEAMYIKTLELNPNDFFAQYNLCPSWEQVRMNFCSNWAEVEFGTSAQFGWRCISFYSQLGNNFAHIL